MVQHMQINNHINRIKDKKKNHMITLTDIEEALDMIKALKKLGIPQYSTGHI